MTVTDAGSLADYLPPVAARTPSSLVSAASFARLRDTARTLPGSLSHTFGFECPLGAGAARADLLVGFRAAQGRHGLAGLVPDVLAHPAATRLHDFVETWADPTSVVGGVVDNLWLEYDLEGHDDQVPSVFFGFRPPGPEGGSAPGDEAGWRLDRRFDAFSSAVRLLRGDGSSLPPAVRRAFRGGAGAEVFQAGVMLSRATDALRLCLRLRSLEDASGYLARTGWEGDPARLVADLAPLARFADYVCLDVDVAAQVQPKVGLECYLDRRDRWPPFLEALVAEGLCTGAERDGLLAYPGQDAAEEVGEAWPVTLSRAARVIGPRSRSICLRSLHHVKVVHDARDPSSPLAAKAYLAVNYRWKDVL